MYRLAASLDLLFTEAGPDYADRIRAAADAGLDAVEMWGTSGKDLPSIGAALRETGIELLTLVVEPRVQFMIDPNHEPFYEGLRRAAGEAAELGCHRLVVTSGIGFPGQKRRQQIARLIDVFSRAAEIASAADSVLLLENVNTRVDHPGSLLDLTSECVEVIRGVDSPAFALLYDLYHSLTMGEDPAAELANAAGLVSHVQIADPPDRSEPGSGTADWPALLATLRASGYDGAVGLEYYPVTPTVESLAYIRVLAASA